jgi:hypothetical protein
MNDAKVQMLRKRVKDLERQLAMNRNPQKELTLRNQMKQIKSNLAKEDPDSLDVKEGNVFCSFSSFMDIDNEQELIEASNFINFLVKKAEITKDRAEHLWKKAKSVFKKNPKYKDKDKEDKYKIIAGIAKRMAKINEEGGGPGDAANGVGGSALNTTSSIGGVFAAKLGEIPNKPGQYKPNPKTLMKRRTLSPLGNPPRTGWVAKKVKPTRPPKMRNESVEESYKSLKDEMVNYIKDKFKGLLDPHEEASNNFDIEAAIYWFASDWYDGQFSDLYKILSTSDFKPSPLHRSVKDEGEGAKDMYDALVDKYENKKESVNVDKYIDKLFE